MAGRRVLAAATLLTRRTPRTAEFPRARGITRRSESAFPRDQPPFGCLFAKVRHASPPRNNSNAGGSGAAEKAGVKLPLNDIADVATGTSASGSQTAPNATGSVLAETKSDTNRPPEGVSKATMRKSPGEYANWAELAPKLVEKLSAGMNGTGIVRTIFSKLPVADACTGTGAGGTHTAHGCHAVTEKLQVPEIIVARDTDVDAIRTPNVQAAVVMKRRIAGSSPGICTCCQMPRILWTRERMQ
jgi:hypothetical protein